MIERITPIGDSDHRITVPVPSALVSTGWLSFSVDGTATLSVWFQKTGSGISDFQNLSVNQMQRWQSPVGIPAGTEFITVHVANATGVGSILVELKAW